MEPTRDEKLQLTVKRIFRSEGVPPFEKHAREVYVRALDPDGTSAQLTGIILKDLGLTAQSKVREFNVLQPFGPGHYERGACHHSSRLGYCPAARQRHPLYRRLRAAIAGRP